MGRIIASVGHTMYYHQYCGVVILLRKCTTSVTHTYKSCRNHLGKHLIECQHIRKNKFENVHVSTLFKGARCRWLAPQWVPLLSSFCRLSFPKYRNASLDSGVLEAHRDGPVLRRRRKINLKLLFITCYLHNLLLTFLAQFPYIQCWDNRLWSTYVTLSPFFNIEVYSGEVISSRSLS